MPRLRRSVVLGLCLLLFAVSGCGGTDDPADTQFADNAAPEANGVTEDRTTQAPAGPQSVGANSGMEPGTYLAQDFAVPFTFEVDSAEWRIFESEPRLITPGIDGQGVMAISAPDRVYDPRDGYKPVDPPGDLVRWLREHPLLTVRASRQVNVGGLDGWEVDLVGDSVITGPPCDDPCAPITPKVGMVGHGRYPHWLRLHKGQTESLAVLQRGSNLVVIQFNVEGPATPSFLRKARAFLDGIEFKGAT